MSLVLDRGCIGRSATPAIGIHADFIPAGTAHEFVNRLAEGFAEDVPEGQLDAGDGRAFQHAAFPEFLPDHDLREVPDAGGVFADQQVFQIE